MLFYFTTLITSNSILASLLLIGIFRYRSLKNNEKIFIYYVGFITCIEIYTEISILVFDVGNTNSIYPIYIGGEFFLLTCMLLTSINNITSKWYIVAGIITLLIFSESVFLFTQNEDVTMGIGKVVSHLTITCFTGYLLIKGLKDLETENPFLLIYSCLFLYYSISLFLFLLLNQLSTLHNDDASILWGMNNILSSILYGGSLYTLIKLKR